MIKLIIVFLLLSMYPVEGYSALCWGFNNTCVSHLMNTQYIGGNGTYSYFTPESVCQSCIGDSDCNNSNPLCTKQLVNLTYRTICPIINQNLTLVNFSVNQIPLLLPGIPSSNNFKSVNSLKRDVDPTIRYIGSDIFVTTNDLYHTFFLWHVNECDGTIYCATSCETTVKPVCLTKDGILTVKVFILDTLVANESFSIKASETCIIKDCSFICIDYFTNFVCYSIGTQVILGIAFLTAILSFIIILLYGFYKIHNCMRGKYIVKMPSDHPGFNVLILSFILLFSVCSAQCTTTNIITSEINSCSFNNGTSVCSIQLNQLIVLQHLGSKACVTFKSPTGDFLGFMNISYELSITKAETAPLYFTSSWVGESCSSKSCRGSDYCTGNGCTQDQTTLNQYLSGPCLLWPGRSGCETSCGCAGCLCFICADACVAKRYALRSTGNIAQVFDILLTKLIPRIRVDLKINGTADTVTLDVEDTKVDGPFTISLLGSFDGPATVFGNNKFITFNNNGYLASASAYNNPQFGSVGDIQASSSTSFMTPSQSSYIIPAQIPSSTSTQSSVIYSFPPAGTSLLNSNTKLPKMIASQMWAASGTELQAINNDPPAISISVSSVPMVLSYTRTRVCPNIESYTLHGCYNCPMGFSITLLAYSVCDEGAVSIKIETNSRLNCYNTFTQLDTVKTSEIIYCSSLDRQISGKVILTGDTVSEIQFSSVLENPPPLSQQEIQDIYGNFTPSNNYDSFSDFWNSLEGTAAIAKWVIASVIIFIVVIILLYSIYFFYSWYTTKQSFQNLKDYEEMEKELNSK